MSNINTSTLNELYPVPGVDNDTQGFRTNFANIKLNLDIAKQELEELHTTSIKRGENSEFDGMDIINANLVATTESVVLGGLLLDDYQLSFREGHYHSYTIGDDIDISLNNWPFERYARIIVEVTGDSETTRKLTFSGPSSIDNIKYSNNWPIATFGHTLIVSNSSSHVVEFWTADSANSIYAFYKGQY